ncbi:hypothetical protein H0Z09_06730 [Pseudomonas sp. SWRI18]|uniref:hypothetical protein n=1 Tax=Pseudomonas sp. SWRI18 TaxID=2753888 RepID=UPI001645A695|nr:hypothetical protein [Pseudomonas sp. SWRI18]MBC3300810.1 hypothetical protein [Pseudomonas sp. SWRI18]
MTIRYAKTLSITLVCLMIPTLSWAAQYDCAVYDKNINGGLGADARLSDDLVEADSVEEAVAKTRKSLDQKRTDDYLINCRKADDE